MASRKESGSVSGTVMASTGGTLDSPVKQIQIEGLVSLTTPLCRCVLVLCFRRQSNRSFTTPDVDASSIASINMADIESAATLLLNALLMYLLYLVLFNPVQY